MLLSLVSALVLAGQTPPPRDAGAMSTAPGVEAGETERFREAVAYANPMPRGAPEADYPLVAWCEALVNGHVALGETLTNADPLDQDIIRLGKLEAADFRKAALDACRAAALQSLPLIRGSQNADARTSEALRACGEGLVAWRDDWRDALGLAGKRPRRIRPDAERLARGRDQVLTRLDRALAELKALDARRNDVEGRLAALGTPL